MGIALIVPFAVLSCAPQSPTTEDEAQEIRQTVIMLEERLLEVNEELVDARNSAGLDVQAENTVSQAAYEVQDIAEILSMISTILAGSSAR